MHRKGVCICIGKKKKQVFFKKKKRKLKFKISYCNKVIPLSHSSFVKNPIFAASRCQAKTNMIICKRGEQ